MGSPPKKSQLTDAMNRLIVFLVAVLALAAVACGRTKTIKMGERQPHSDEQYARLRSLSTKNWEAVRQGDVERVRPQDGNKRNTVATHLERAAEKRTQTGMKHVMDLNNNVRWMPKDRAQNLVPGKQASAEQMQKARSVRAERAKQVEMHDKAVRALQEMARK